MHQNIIPSIPRYLVWIGLACELYLTLDMMYANRTNICGIMEIFESMFSKNKVVYLLKIIFLDFLISSKSGWYISLGLNYML